MGYCWFWWRFVVLGYLAVQVCSFHCPCRLSRSFVGSLAVSNGFAQSIQRREGPKNSALARSYYHTITYHTILYYPILYQTIYYARLYYPILYYTILYCTALYYTMLYCTILYCTILYYTILYYTILYYTMLLESRAGVSTILRLQLEPALFRSHGVDGFIAASSTGVGKKYSIV